MKVKLFIDKEFIESSGKIGVHPNDNTATVWLKIDIISYYIIKKALINWMVHFYTT